MLASPALAVGQKVLPNAREMDAIMSLYQTETGDVDTKSDMYTEDAWAGIKKFVPCPWVTLWLPRGSDP